LEEVIWLVLALKVKFADMFAHPLVHGQFKGT
jgi:hypothetical protein